MKRGRLLPVLGLALAGVSCSSHALPSQATPTTLLLAPTSAPSTPSSPAPRRPAAAGTLAGRTLPAASVHVAVDVAFQGLTTQPLGPGRVQMVYPWLTLQSDRSGALLAHLKLPYFDCPTPAPGMPVQQRDCSDRRVLYADADAGSTVFTVDRAGHLDVDVQALVYRYGSAVDRSARTPLVPTGATTHLHVVVTPGEVLSQQGRRLVWRPLATATAATAPEGGAPTSSSASQDDGYRNRYTLDLPVA